MGLCTMGRCQRNLEVTISQVHWYGVSVLIRSLLQARLPPAQAWTCQQGDATNSFGNLIADCNMNTHQQLMQQESRRLLLISSGSQHDLPMPVGPCCALRPLQEQIPQVASSQGSQPAAMRMYGRLASLLCSKTFTASKAYRNHTEHLLQKDPLNAFLHSDKVCIGEDGPVAASTKLCCFDTHDGLRRCVSGSVIQCWQSCLQQGCLEAAEAL